MKREVFIEKAKKIHGDKYDYSKIISSNIKNKFEIICRIHGVFHLRGDAHLSGQGCSLCGGSKRKTKSEFIFESKKIHGDKYDYSRVNYINAKTKVEIICPIHGMFKQTPDNHINGCGCSKCGFQKTATTKINNSSDNFYLKAKKIHGDKYDYSRVNYINAKTKVEIICPIHGMFKQTPNEHLSDKSCLICSLIETKPEIEIKAFFYENNISFIGNNREILNGKEIDVYIPTHKIGIEFNGLYWHSNKFKDRNYHLNKTLLCEKNDIQLLHVFEDEWILKKEIVKSIIKSKLNIFNNKIYGRKTQIREITDNKLIREFLNNNHLQGFVGSKIKLGLFYKNEIVSLMTFGKKRIAMGNKLNGEGEYEMLRFCNKLNTQVIGGASKLLKYFIKIYQPKSITSFADRRYSNGELYKTLGFKHISNTQPNYWYFKTNEIIRHHRFKFRKDVLVREGFNAQKTEYEIMDEREYMRIYDCGNMKFELT